MANNNQNKNLKIQGRILVTTNNEVLIVFLDPNTGWQYTVIQLEVLPNGDINKLAWVSSSKLHCATMIEPLVKSLYSNIKLPIPSSASVQIGNYRPLLLKDLSEALLGTNHPFEIASKNTLDTNNLTLETYLTNTFGYPDVNNPGKVTLGFELQDITFATANVAANHFKPYDMAAHDPWSNIKPEEVEFFKTKTAPILKTSVIKSSLYQKLLAHLQYNDETTNQKGMAIYGDPGTGKTTAVRVLAEELNLPYAAITGNPAVTTDDLFGYVIPNDSATDPKPWITEWTNVLKVAEAGGIVVFDEANNFSLAVQIGLNNVVYGAERFVTFQNRTFKVHPKTIFIITTNFREQGNNPMNGAFKDRFEPFVATEFNSREYSIYLKALYPTINPKGLDEYVKFMYAAIADTRQLFENQDQYSPDTPCFRTRDISRILVRAFTHCSLKNALGDTLAAHTVGVEDNITKVKAWLEKHLSVIQKIEQMFFQDPNASKQSDAMMKELMAVGVSSLNVNAGTSTNVDDMLNKANNFDGSDDILSSADGLNW